MIFNLGTRLRNLATRLGVFTFRVSIATFESKHSIRLSRGNNSVESGSKALRPASDPLVQAPTIATSRTGAGKRIESNAIPIVFIHKNNSEHLKYSFAQAKTSNPNSTVFVLGDESNRNYAGIEHHRFDRYFEGAAKFKEVYRHYSTHPVDFELICFQRWFILRDFLKAHGIEQCVYLDSDVLLYANITDDLKKFKRFDFTLCWNTIGCVFFLNRLGGLSSFCDFLMDIYSKKDLYHYDKMVSHFAARRKNRLAGGACDMTALQLFNELNFGQVGEASHVIDGSVYDPNINMPHPGFEMEDGIKKIVWKNGQPYGRFARTGEEIRFNSLHFNGRAKNLMNRYCTATLEPVSGTATHNSVNQ